MYPHDTKVRTFVWDLPVRLFHGLLIALVALQFLTGQFEWLSMRWHFWFGYVTLALLVFRVLWGIFGSDTARFNSFIRRPAVIYGYLRSFFDKSGSRSYGHNPLGGLAVLAMLLCLLFQSITGLFSADDIGEVGPLSGLLSDQAVKWMTHWHRLNRNILMGLIALHLTAVLFYLIVMRQNLIAPMITGWTTRYQGALLHFATLKRAFWLFILSVCLIVLVIGLSEIRNG